MKSNTPEISNLRQMLDVLGAQCSSPVSFDAALVRNCARQIAFAAADPKVPIPDDIFQPGIDDTIMRIMLGSVAQQMVTAAGSAEAAAAKMINGKKLTP